MQPVSLITVLMLSVSVIAMSRGAEAAEIEAKSRIDGVTVYPDAASITRKVDVYLPAGSTTLVFKGLPMGIDPGSLRVEGQSSGRLTIGSVEMRVTPTVARPPDGSSLARLKQLRGDREAWQTSLDALEAK